MYDDDAEIIESESLRPDRRANRAGCTIIAHHTRESFMHATGQLPAGTLLPRPIPAGISAAEARKGLREAFSAPLIRGDRAGETARQITRERMACETQRDRR